MAQSGSGIAAPAVLALPDKPSIAVLPFQNMSGDPEQEYFADGMVEDIITVTLQFPVRDRPQFELYLQGKGGRHQNGRPRTRRALRAGRKPPESRWPGGAHHRSADRCGERRPSLGGQDRRRIDRRLRALGPDNDERGILDRAEDRTGGDRAGPAKSYERR